MIVVSLSGIIMLQTRSYQLQQYTYMPHPNEQQEPQYWWYKLELLASHFCEAVRKFCIPGSSIPIDETMVRCFGRTFTAIRCQISQLNELAKLHVTALPTRANPDAEIRQRDSSMSAVFRTPLTSSINIYIYILL
jgi:hypothetical protein